MDIYHGLDEITGKYNNSVIALGNFDGVHLGHRELIKKAIQLADRTEGVSGVFTFDPHPMTVIQPDCSPPLLLTKEDKIKILSEMGIKLLIICQFSQEIARLTPEQFVRDILVNKLAVSAVVVGYNYNFGYRGSGTPEMLTEFGAKFGFDVITIPPVKRDDTEVSSTLIRRLLLKGDVSEAAGFLGYYPFVISRVVTGDRRGREIGFPTANLNLQESILVPANGVYAVKVHIKDKIYNGVANVGIKPTFKLNQPKNLEVHCFDFSADIYNTRIKVEFIARLRGEKGFSSVQDLVTQINEDVKKAKLLLQA
ncbi:bifunctional riboflavin kinase/FAD synthetase [Phosphitispora sp. TUW77]|uniref:bifunctional riboflavin kinase/FAD synthetase n=1 Tax=Phosphitispora sp. TUW77 TaxID=3152361 RepID=UPI003AB1AC23